MKVIKQYTLVSHTGANVLHLTWEQHDFIKRLVQTTTTTEQENNRHLLDEEAVQSVIEMYLCSPYITGKDVYEAYYDLLNQSS